MTIRSILLGTAAVSMVATSAYAADLPASAEPADYVQVCDAFGTGFFRLPGSDTCLRVGGNVRAQYNYKMISAVGDEDDKDATETGFTGTGNTTKTVQVYEEADTEVSYNARGRVFVDARTGTDWGTVKAFTQLSGSTTGEGAARAEINEAFIQVGGLTVGKSGSASNVTYGSYANNENYGTYDADQSPWLVKYELDVGYGVVVAASVEQAVGTGFSSASTIADYDTASLNSDLIPDVGIGAELAQGWGKVKVGGGLHSLSAEATALKAEDSEDDPTDLTGFGFFGGGGVEVNVLSTTKVGANGWWGMGALNRIGAGGHIDDAYVHTPVEDGKAAEDDELLSASGFTANGGLSHSFGTVSIGANGGFFSVSDGKETEAKTVTGFMAGGSVGYSPVSNLTFTVGGEFQSLTETTAADDEDKKNDDYVDLETTRSAFGVTANVVRSF